MSSALDQPIVTSNALFSVLAIISRGLRGTPMLPRDIVLDIFEFNYPANRLFLTYNWFKIQHPALKPPKNGRCMMQEIPSEVRRQIFGDFLPDKETVIQPFCSKQARARDLRLKPKHNAVSDLMLISRSYKADVTACVYSERKFAIHVHEGIYDGGIEFLDAGRQRLHYKTSLSDDRFTRFDQGEFGFNQLKKIEISIYPSCDESRFNAMTTYYINHALVRMLERNRGSSRIVSLVIQFAGLPPEIAQTGQNRRQIARAEAAWWDIEKNAPRETSLHNISDVELALRPFAMLTTVHDVRIILPNKVNRHEASRRFAQDLEKSMTSNTVLGTLGPNDDLERHAEFMRSDIENMIFSMKYGGKGVKVPKLNEHDWHSDNDEDDEDKGDTDNSFTRRGNVRTFKWDNADGDGRGEGDEDKSAFQGSGKKLGEYDEAEPRRIFENVNPLGAIRSGLTPPGDLRPARNSIFGKSRITKTIEINNDDEDELSEKQGSMPSPFMPNFGIDVSSNDEMARLRASRLSRQMSNATGHPHTEPALEGSEQDPMVSNPSHFRDMRNFFDLGFSEPAQEMGLARFRASQISRQMPSTTMTSHAELALEGSQQDPMVIDSSGDENDEVKMASFRTITKSINTKNSKGTTLRRIAWTDERAPGNTKMGQELKQKNAEALEERMRKESAQMAEEMKQKIAERIRNVPAPSQDVQQNLAQALHGGVRNEPVSKPTATRTMKKGVSSLDVDALGLGGDEAETQGKAVKRNGEDSPGSPRVSSGFMRSLGREAEARRVAYAGKRE